MVNEVAEEKKMQTVMINGQEIEIEEGSRLFAQLVNEQTKQQDEQFDDTRKEFCEDVKETIDKLQSEDMIDALEGQTLMYDLGTDEIKLVKTELITLKKRVNKKKDE